MLYILSGPDDYSIARSLEEIKKEIGDPATLAMSTTTLEGPQVTPDELRTVCQTLPFLSGKRLVIVEGLLGRFNPGNRPRSQGRTRQTLRQSSGKASSEQAQERNKQFATCFEKLPESTIAVLIDAEIKSGNSLFKELAGKATVKSFPPLKGAALNKWAQNKVTAEGGNISPKALTLLTKLVGSDLWIMASEIDKLILFARDRRIEEEDVKTIVGYTQQVTVFNMIDAILEFKAEPAEQSLQKLLESGSAPSQLLSMLARQIQLIIRAGELKKQRKPSTEIQSKLGITNEFVFRKTLEQAGKHSLSRLREVYHYLLDTDLSIKTGQLDAELALTILVAELSQRSKARVGQAL